MNNLIKTAMGEVIRAQRSLDFFGRHNLKAHNALDSAFTLLLRAHRSEHYRLSAYAGTFGPELYSLDNARIIAQEIANRENIPVSVLAQSDAVVSVLNPRS
jgi:hypothetical protein